ncbi:MAG: hypothetical protein KDA91_14865 [Planctomycetaceae bacterium]|nr:hypothetical protein [Planctomycetaceae bacterium]
MTQPTDPTPEQIHEGCEQIQSSWTPEERQRRLRVDWRTDVPAIAAKPHRLAGGLTMKGGDE